MKKTMIMMAVMAMLIIGAISAEAKNRSKRITFSNDVTVNGTVVKKGSYDVKFDAQNNEVTILDDGRVIATTKVDVQMVERKNPHNTAAFVERNNSRVLTTITFEGDRRILTVVDGGSQSAGSE